MRKSFAPLFGLLMLLIFPECLPDQKAQVPAGTKPPLLTDSGPTKNYSEIIDSILAERKRLAGQYSNASSDPAKAAVLKKARNFLMKALLEEVFPAWYGTTWEFYGHTDVPQQGSIAYGYFVSTPLKHCGFNLNRFKLAQQYSVKIVETLCRKDIQRIGHSRLDRVLAYIDSHPNDLYVVGLDNHVGFLAKTEEGIFFIHSNYFSPVAVVKEKASGSPCLASSENFIFGHFLSNDAIIAQWLTEETIHIPAN